MIFNENGEILNEGFFSNIKDKLSGKKKEEVKYLSEEDNTTVANNYKKLYPIVKRSFDKNIKIIANKYDDSSYYKASLTKIFKMCGKEDEDDIIYGSYTNESMIDFIEADIFKLINPRSDAENDNRFFNVGVELCKLINEDLSKQYPNIKIEMEDDMDWDDFYYGYKIKYLLKM